LQLAPAIRVQYSQDNVVPRWTSSFLAQTPIPRCRGFQRIWNVKIPCTTKITTQVYVERNKYGNWKCKETRDLSHQSLGFQLSPTLQWLRIVRSKVGHGHPCFWKFSLSNISQRSWIKQLNYLCNLWVTTPVCTLARSLSTMLFDLLGWSFPFWGQNHTPHKTFFTAQPSKTCHDTLASWLLTDDS
jgi:hypothetical protein